MLNFLKLASPGLQKQREQKHTLSTSEEWHLKGRERRSHVGLTSINCCGGETELYSQWYALHVYTCRHSDSYMESLLGKIS